MCCHFLVGRKPKKRKSGKRQMEVASFRIFHRICHCHQPSAAPHYDDSSFFSSFSDSIFPLFKPLGFYIAISATHSCLSHGAMGDSSFRPFESRESRVMFQEYDLLTTHFLPSAISAFTRTYPVKLQFLLL